MSRSEHITTIDGPNPDGLWSWRCLADGCTAALHDGEQVAYFDLGDTMLFAGAHGPLDQAIDIVQVIGVAVALNCPPRAIAFYDDLIPKWEQNFPWKVHELHAMREEFVAKRAALVSALTQ